MPASIKPESDRSDQNAVRIELWGEGDLPLLKKLLGDPAMTEHLGGPESDEQLANRHARYLRLVASGNDRVFKIIHQPTGESVGSVSYWERTWHGEQVYEIGWSVIPAFQGRGIARAATSLAIINARSDGKHRFLHAFWVCWQYQFGAREPGPCWMCHGFVVLLQWHIPTSKLKYPFYNNAQPNLTPPQNVTLSSPYRYI
jgi:hypothetical protein